MDALSKVFLAGVGLLGLSHGIAITTESQIAAQISWLLIFGLVAVAALLLINSAYNRYSGNGTR